MREVAWIEAPIYFTSVLYLLGRRCAILRARGASAPAGIECEKDERAEVVEREKERAGLKDV